MNVRKNDVVEFIERLVRVEKLAIEMAKLMAVAAEQTQDSLLRQMIGIELDRAKSLGLMDGNHH
jgi:hypothetical protein